MQVFGDPTAVDDRNLRGDAVLVGWNQQDEPDNAQADGMGGFDRHPGHAPPGFAADRAVHLYKIR